MSWKDYLYIHKGDRIAIILLLILIVISGGIYILVSIQKENDKTICPESEREFEAFIEKLKDTDSTNSYPQENHIQKDSTQYTEYAHQEKLKTGETIEINSSDTTDLKKIPGIGSAFSNRIVKYRNLLGGYNNLNQLKEVWGMDDDLFNKIIPYLKITPNTKKIKVNTASFEELNKHPYIKYKRAKMIIDIRERKGKIESIDRLSLLEEFTETDTKRLTPYLSFD